MHLLILLVMLWLTGSSEVEATQYKLNLLPKYLSNNYSAAIAINNNGQIAGYAGRSTSAKFLTWSGSSITYTGLTFNETRYMAINDLGEVVMWQNKWKDGVRTSFPKLDPLSGMNMLRDINNFGVIAGCSVVYVTDPYTHSYTEYYYSCLWDDSELHQLQTLPNVPTGDARGVNESGQVVGQIGTYPNTVAARWDNGELSLLAALQGYEHSVAEKINNQGLIVGSSYSESVEKATLWSGGEVIDLLPEATNSRAYDVNDQGQVIGLVLEPNQYVQSFVWENGSVTYLEGLGRSTRVYGINDNGWIVGQSNEMDGYRYAVMWEPIVPEPSSMFALLCGISTVGFGLRRRKPVRGQGSSRCCRVNLKKCLQQ